MKFYTGTNGDDYEMGTDDDDILDGLAGNDTLIGGDGNDRIDAGLGIDIVDGGYGDDTLVVDYSSNAYAGINNFGITTTLFNSGNGFSGTITAPNSVFNFDRVDFSSIERFKIIGTNGQDILAGGYQQDTLIAGAGDDIIQDNFGGDIIDGGDGFDLLKNAIFNPYPLGGMFNPYSPIPMAGISIDDLGTLIIAPDGSSIKNIEQFDTVITGNGDDTINFVRRGNNTIITGDGNDTIDAGLGIDTVDGGYGDDTLVVDYSSNAYAGINNFGITTTLFNTGSGFTGSIMAPNNTFDFDRVDFSSIERFKIIGTSRNDILIGGFGQDIFTGGAGDDIIDGGNGGDTLVYAGAIDTYTIERLDTSWIVSDTNIFMDGNDGIDRLTNVSNLTFSNGSSLLIDDLIGSLSDDNLGTNIVSENSANGTIVSEFRAIAVDGNGQAVAYSLLNNDNGRFSIDSSSGLLSIADSSSIDFETDKTHEISVKATSADGSFTQKNFTIEIANVNEAPTGTASGILTNGTEDTTYTIDLAKLLVGFSDVDGDTLTVANLTADRGTIAINNGVYTFTPTANYNGDVKLSYDIIDGYGGTIAANSTFNLVTVNDAPILTINNSIATIAENATAGLIPGAVAIATDVDSPSSNITFSLVNPPKDINDRSLFEIDANTGQISLTAWGAATIDYEITPSYTLTIKANDGIIDSNIETILVNLIDITEPTISIANLTVVEGLDNNALVTFSLSKAWHQTISANYTTSGDTAITNIDYSSLSGQISFTPGETTKTISIPILNDNINEGNENFNIILSNPINATIPNAQAVVTITDTLIKNVTTNLNLDAPLVENLTLTETSNINATGNAFNNIIIGNTGNNIIEGGAGNDTMNGTLGDDTYTFNLASALGNDIINESANSGSDNLKFISNTSIKVDLSITTNQSVNTNLVLTVMNIENVTGGNGNDTITGNSISNILIGGAGNDILTGGAGNDILTGGTGKDIFSFGGSGFVSVAAIGIDKIQDFVIVEDKIQLSKSTFTILTSNLTTSTFKKVTTDAAAETSTAIISYNTTNGKLFYNTNGNSLGFGNNGGQFAEIAPSLNLTTSNFLSIA